MDSLIFVYGTLKEGFPNFDINTGRRQPGEFETCVAMPLYLVGKSCTPWLLDVPGQGHTVRGEVFAVDAPTLAAMDILEDVTQADGYRRIDIDVRRVDLAGFAPIRVQAYLKPAALLPNTRDAPGPFPSYTPEHAQLYRNRRRSQS
jgi:gamma-glutamylaminecyclotransferase